MAAQTAVEHAHAVNQRALSRMSQSSKVLSGELAQWHQEQRKSVLSAAESQVVSITDRLESAKQAANELQTDAVAAISDEKSES